MNSSSNPREHLYYGVYSNVHFVSLLSSQFHQSDIWTEQLKNLGIQPTVQFVDNRNILIIHPETKKIESIYQLESYITLNTIIHQYGEQKDIYISAILQFLFELIPKINPMIINQIGFKFYYYVALSDWIQVPFSTFVKPTFYTALGTKLSQLANEYVRKVQINSQHEFIWVDEKCSCEVTVHNHNKQETNSQGILSQTNTGQVTGQQVTGQQVTGQQVTGQGAVSQQFISTSQSPNQTIPTTTSVSVGLNTSNENTNNSYQQIFGKPLNEVFSSSSSIPGQTNTYNSFTTRYNSPFSSVANSSSVHGFNSTPSSSFTNPFSTTNQFKPSTFTTNNVFGQKFNY